jgi:hypothetical protein
LWITIHLSSNETNAAELRQAAGGNIAAGAIAERREELLPLQKTPTTAICLRLSIFI